MLCHATYIHKITQNDDAVLISRNKMTCKIEELSAEYSANINQLNVLLNRLKNVSGPKALIYY